jgi:hypothetical protein
MQKIIIILVIIAACVGGWLKRDLIMAKVGPPPPEVNTADLAPEGSRYRQESASSGKTEGIYSWKDKDGNTHFGNRDVSNDAQEVQLSKSNTMHLSGKPSAHAPSGAGRPEHGRAQPPQERAAKTLHGAAMKQQAEINMMSETQ